MSIVAALQVCAAFQYWSDPRIHNLGNVGIRGAIHAVLAPVSTHIIDRVAYDGLDLRDDVLRRWVPDDANTVDVCCGVGFSTKPGGVGVDTSDQMLFVARALHGKNGTKFVRGNAETWQPEEVFDVATCFFAMHEVPRDARRRILANMLTLAPTALVVDISPVDYTPSKSMLLGEPYLLEYQQHIDADVAAVADEHGATFGRQVLVEGHAVLWTLQSTRIT